MRLQENISGESALRGKIYPFICFWSVKGIVSPDWKDLQMVSLDRFEV
jgi:hypothetical protein